MSLTITTATGSVSVDAFRVVQDEISYERRAEKAKGTNVHVVRGDLGKRPAPLVIECEVQEADLDTTMSDIRDILEAARVATSVTTPRGSRAVDGIVWSELRHSRQAVVATLAFAPTGGSYS